MLTCKTTRAVNQAVNNKWFIVTSRLMNSFGRTGHDHDFKVRNDHFMFMPTCVQDV
jgi:hypothetical protein